ncbi:MAG: aspartate ammonia-lyase [Thaumarchaeota archaeon]|nr:aspartate ammonia-lyase [Nitrososphaerota archaeon]
MIRNLQKIDHNNRTDIDSLGQVKLPSDAYYGPFTARAINQYNATGIRTHNKLVQAFVMIKRSAAIANMKTSALNKKIGNAIVKACDIMLDGKFIDQIVIDSINSGAGTALHMNINEVITNIALEIIGKKKGQYEYINPNDHANMSQSSNDTFPTAMNIAVLINLKSCISEIQKLYSVLLKKSKQFSSIKKIGRTHLMDAVPVTLGGEFHAYAISINRSLQYIITASKELEFVALGGTAVGTGTNASKKYRTAVIKELNHISKLNLKSEKNLQYSIQSRFSISNLSSTIKNFVLEVNRLSNDIRLMASGPIAGLGEIQIPTVHAGSSIMPGKVNPSLAECMNMICFQVIGNDTTISYAVQSGQLELNVMMPVMAKCILDSIDMLKNFLPIFSSNLINGIVANETKLKEQIEQSPVIVTLLAPKIGYNKASKLFKKALEENKSIREIISSENILTNDEFNLLIRR